MAVQSEEAKRLAELAASAKRMEAMSTKRKSQEELQAEAELKRYNTIQSLAERQHAILTTILKASIKRNDLFDGAYDDISESLHEQISKLNTLPVMAESISKNLGMEKGTKRIMEDQLAAMINKDKNISDALKHGDSGEVKDKMVEALTKQLEKMDFKDAEDKARHEMLIKELKDNFETAFDWDKIQEKGNSVFFPLTQKFWVAAEGLRIAATKIPVFGKLASEEMIEHYRQGIEEIGGIFQTHMSTIMAPMDAILGPLKAVGKSMFAIGKTLFSDPSNYEKETAKYTRLTYEATMNTGQAARRRWLEDKKQMIKDKAGKLYEKSGAEKFIKWLKKGFILVIAVIGAAMGALVGQILLPFRAIASAMGAVGGIMKSIPALQKFAQQIPTFITAVGKITGIFSGVIAKIKGVFSTAQYFLTSLPKFGKYFGTFFKWFKFGIGKLAWPLQIVMSLIDFVKGFQKTEGNILQRIIGGLEEAVIGFLELPIKLFGWIVEKVMGLFGVEVDGIADGIIGMIRSVYDFLKNPLDKIKSFWPFGGTKEEGVGEEEEKPLSRKGFISRKTEGTHIAGELYVPGKPLSERQKGELRTSKSMGNQLPHGITDKDIAVAKQQQAQIDVVTTTGKKLDAVNNSLTENNSQQQVIIQNIQNSSRKEQPREIPTDTSDLGIMFNNVIYGAS